LTSAFWLSILIKRFKADCDMNQATSTDHTRLCADWGVFKHQKARPSVLRCFLLVSITAIIIKKYKHSLLQSLCPQRRVALY
jgi:hypothetical protein